MSEHVQALYTMPNPGKPEELIMRVTNYAWSEMTLVEQQELREQAASELATLRAQLAEAVEALRPFAIANPIGVSNQWMPDFERAASILARHQG